MIYDSLAILKRELNNYLNVEVTSTEIEEEGAVLGNIALFESPDDNGSENLDNRVVISLVNIKQEKTLKNIPAAEKTNGSIRYKNPPVIVNLFVLFTATHKKYDNALKMLSQVIAFFQGKNVFTHLDKATKEDAGIVSPFRLIIDLYSSSFEENNHLWGTLGGKQLPHVLYKVRLTEIERPSTKETRETIKDVNAHYNT